MPVVFRGSKLNATDIAFFARRAGWRGRQLEIAVAIALCESSGWTGAHNPVGLDDSYGLWQINLRGDLESRLDKFNVTRDGLKKAWINAHVAFAIYKEANNSFLPWSCYTSQKYRGHLLRAAQGVQQEPRATHIIGIERSNWNEDTGYPVGEEPLIDVPWFFPPFNPDDPNSFGILDNALNLIQGISDAITFLTKPENWLRVAGFVGGGILLLFGFILAARETGIGEKAANAIPMAKLARKVAK